MTIHYETFPVTISLDTILREYAKENIKLNNDFTHISTDFFVDTHKNKVCFLISTMKKEDTGA